MLVLEIPKVIDCFLVDHYELCSVYSLHTNSITIPQNTNRSSLKPETSWFILTVKPVNTLCWNHRSVDIFLTRKRQDEEQ